METLIYQMRSSVLAMGKQDKQKAKSSIKSFMHVACRTLQKDELEEFLRDVEVLNYDIEELYQPTQLIYQ